MNTQKFYEEIENLIVDVEAINRFYDYKKTEEKVEKYWQIGKLLVEAQGGERAKYGDNLIKKWGKSFEKKYGRGYSVTNLKRFRKFFKCFTNGAAMRHLSWTHIKSLLSIKDENERNFYINEVIRRKLSTRELDLEIKNKTFDRLALKDKNNIKIIGEEETELTIEDIIKDPIIIPIENLENVKISEKILHKEIINMLENRFLELGLGFALIGHEYKIKLDNKTYRIDLLFFNVELNCYVVMELKLKEYSPKDIGQLKLYVSYVNDNLKKSYHHDTIGILLVREKNKLVVKYTTNKDIFIIDYQLIEKR